MTFLSRPGGELPDPIYSNFDYEIDQDVAKLLLSGDCHGFHAARDFCGYVWRLANGRWVEQVWRHHQPVQDVFGDSIEAVIKLTNDQWGYE